jgi:hypothetical protein
MKKKLIQSFFALSLLSSSFAIEVSKGKVHIKETEKRAQLSLILQVSDADLIPKGSSFEKEVLLLLKQSLKDILSQKAKLKQHKRFTHIFVTAIENSLDEEPLAMFAKTPERRLPVIQIFKKVQPEEQVAMDTKPPVKNMFEQIR